MTLDIIIPHYKESEDTIKPLLSSIDNQQAVDFKFIKVILVNDGNEVILSDSFLKQFKNLNINYLIKQHGGVSAARNVGLRHSKADYVMFCDADDMFIKLDALYNIFNFLLQRQVDLISASFLINVPRELITLDIPKDMANFSQDQKITFNTYATVQKNTELIEALLNSSRYPYNRAYQDIFLHGKVFKRQFLVDNDLEFPEELKFSEDKYFLDLCYAYTNTTLYINEPYYLWKYNTTSLTRQFTHTTADVSSELLFGKQTIESAVFELTAFVKRGKTEKAAMRAFSFIYSLYLILVGYPFVISDRAKNYMQLVTKEICNNFKFFNNLILQYPKELRYNVTSELVNMHKIQPGLNEDAIKQLSFEAWWQKIEELSIQLKEPE